MARTNPAEKGAVGITAFFIPADTPGLRLGKVDKKMGQKGTRTCDVILEDCRVPASGIIGGPAFEGKGFKTAMKVLDLGRVQVSAMAIGSAQRIIDEALGYATQRKQLGQPIADFQLIQAMLADSQTEHAAAKALMFHAAETSEREGAAPMLASCSKYYATEMAGRVADRAVQIHGGSGYMAEYPVERLYRDIRLLRIYEGTSQIQLLIIACSMIRRYHNSH